MRPHSASDLLVRFWGVRGSIPSPLPTHMRYGGNTSCVEVRFGEQLLILDAGSGIRLLGQDLMDRASGKGLEGTLFLSHAHWDHIQGLPFFMPGYSERNRFTVLSGPGKGAVLDQALRNQMSAPHFPVGFEQLHAFGPIAELQSGANVVGDLKVQTTELNHPGGCTGFRIETNRASLGYLPDHEPWPANTRDAHTNLVQFLRGLDLLILDGQYTAEEYPHKIGWGHGCLPNTVEVAIEAGVGRLVLFHHDPSRTDVQIDGMLAEARGLAAGSNTTIIAASENEPLVIMAKDNGRASATVARAGSSLRSTVR